MANRQTQVRFRRDKNRHYYDTAHFEDDEMPTVPVIGYNLLPMIVFGELNIDYSTTF